MNEAMARKHLETRDDVWAMARARGARNWYFMNRDAAITFIFNNVPSNLIAAWAKRQEIWEEAQAFVESMDISDLRDLALGLGYRDWFSARKSNLVRVIMNNMPEDVKRNYAEFNRMKSQRS